MLSFPSMLGPAAEAAGMKTPNFEILGNDWEFDSLEFPHFHVFCAAQLGRPMIDMGEHWTNAKIITEISDEEIKEVTLEDLIDRGLSWTS